MSLGVGGCVWDGGEAEHAHRRAHDERAAAPNVLGRDQSGDLGGASPQAPSRGWGQYSRVSSLVSGPLSGQEVTLIVGWR